MPAPAQEVTFASFLDRWEAKLQLCPRPRPGPSEQFFQLENILEYLETELGCLSVAVEVHYVDRDHMDDHGAFYSKSFEPFPNYCKRVHFFSAPYSDVRTKLDEELAEPLRHGGFFDEHYLGFSVVRPLPGSPVGRTVLRPPRKGSATFPSARKYKVHLLGVELRVHGLAFQQQDLAVSACATTALWSSLQKVRDLEEFRTVSPAQITRGASSSLLSYGRAMPSEGLSIEQMCQAIDVLGLAPALFSARAGHQTRSHVYAATRSGFAPVIVARLLNTEDDDVFHAVAVAGVKLANTRARDGVPRDASSAMTHLYIHDDRLGPYIETKVKVENKRLILNVPHPSPRRPEKWQVTHLLMPIHAKIRLSVSTIEEFAIAIATGIANQTPPKAFTYEYWIEQSQKYLDKLRRVAPTASLSAMISSTAMPRYVAIVRVSDDGVGTIDVLVDTTSTSASPLFIAAVLVARDRHTDEVIDLLREGLGIAVIDCSRP